MNAAAERMAQNGLRVIAYAYKVVDEMPEETCYGTLEKQLQCCELAGMIDPRGKKRLKQYAIARRRASSPS